MNRRETAYQFVKFSLIGFLNTGIHYGLFILLFRYFGLYYLASSAIGYIGGLLNSFVLNRTFTFRASGTRMGIEFVKFAIVNTACLLLNIGSLAFLVNRLGLIPELGQLFAIAISLVLGFVANKFWTFRQRLGPVSEKPSISGEL